MINDLRRVRQSRDSAFLPNCTPGRSLFGPDVPHYRIPLCAGELSIGVITIFPTGRQNRNGGRLIVRYRLAATRSATAGTAFPTSGTITFPATCGGGPVVFGELHVGVEGVNGEVSQATVNISR